MWKTFSVPLVFLLVAAGCAGGRDVQRVDVSRPDAAAVRIEAKSFSFSPPVFTVRSGEPVNLMVENLSRTYHNITIESPYGRTLRSVDLPPGETVPIRIVFKDHGDHPFYCDRFLHGTFGMKGWIRVEE